MIFGPLLGQLWVVFPPGFRRKISHFLLGTFIIQNWSKLPPILSIKRQGRYDLIKKLPTIHESNKFPKKINYHKIFEKV